MTLKCRLRPYDDLCDDEFIDHDGTVEAKIRQGWPEWRGDFDEFASELVSGGASSWDGLRRLTVHDIARFLACPEYKSLSDAAVLKRRAREAIERIDGHEKRGGIVDFIRLIFGMGGFNGGYANTRDAWVDAFKTKAYPASMDPITKWLDGVGITESKQGSGIALTELGECVFKLIEGEREQAKPKPQSIRRAKTG